MDGTIHKFNILDRFRLSHVLFSDEKDLSYSSCVILDEYLPCDLNKMELCEDAIKCLSTANAGGKSILSEALSTEYIFRLYNAYDIIPEMKITYSHEYKMLDLIATLPFQFIKNNTISSLRVGISVTRGMFYGNSDGFTEEQAIDLLNKKLYGLIVARNCVVEAHNFDKCILHIWCQTPRIACLLKKAFESMDINDYGLDVKGCVILILTVCTEEWIYTDKHPIKYKYCPS